MAVLLVKKATRLALGALMAAGLALPGTTFAAVTPPEVNGVQHFIDCFDAMLHHPDEHAQYCGPGQTPPPGSLATPGGPAFECPQQSGLLPEDFFQTPGARVLWAAQTSPCNQPFSPG